jgi:hypothetical protein
VGYESPKNYESYRQRDTLTKLGALSTGDGVHIDILGSSYREPCVYGSNGVCR